MQYLALFIGKFPTYSITLNASDITKVVSRLEKLYSFAQGPMRLEIYDSNKKHLKTLYPFKLEGYTKKCPYGKDPHFCDFRADPWDTHWEETSYSYEKYKDTLRRNEKPECLWNFAEKNYCYSDEQMQEIEEIKERFDLYQRDCPYRKEYGFLRLDWDCKGRDANAVMHAECCLPLKTRYVFTQSLKSAKRLGEKFFKIPVSTTKI